MNLFVVLAVVAVMLLLRWRKPNLLVWALAWWIGFYLVLRFGFTAPIPASVIAIYMGIALLALLAYMTSSEGRRTEISRPLLALTTDPRYKLPLALVIVLLPALAAASVYLKRSVALEPPIFPRTVHPGSPPEITVHERRVDLEKEENPYLALEKTSPDEFRKHVENGRRVYYRNCVFCHGDDMRGDGMFVHGLNPVPTNFTEGTIVGLRDTFVFWRIAKGGPGLPEEGGPWDTAMPAWEKFLTEEEIWDTVLFLYDFNGLKPRAKEHEAGGEH